MDGCKYPRWFDDWIHGPRYGNSAASEIITSGMETSKMSWLTAGCCNWVVLCFLEAANVTTLKREEEPLLSVFLLCLLKQNNCKIHSFSRLPLFFSFFSQTDGGNFWSYKWMCFLNCLLHSISEQSTSVLEFYIFCLFWSWQCVWFYLKCTLILWPVYAKYL